MGDERGGGVSGRSGRALGWAALVVGLLAPALAGEAPRAIVVSWDGAGDEVVDRLLAEGRLPAVAALAERGLAASWVRSSFPSKTAAAHAAIWTGTWAAGSGITANEVPLLPRAEHTLLDFQSGFSSLAATGEPLFLTAALAGRRVVALSATQSIPATPLRERLRRRGVAEDRLTVVGGFESPLASAEAIDAAAFGPARPGWNGVAHRQGAREAVLRVAGTTFHLLLYDDPADPVRGLDRLLVRVGSRDRRRASAEAVLAAHPAGAEPAAWSPPFCVVDGSRHANTFFRLFDLAPDGSRVLLYRRAAYALSGAIAPADLAAYEKAYPGFQDSGFAAYVRGDLGATLGDGGSGEAERRVLEIVAFDVQLLTAGATFALRAWQPDLLFHYALEADDAGHAWMGMLDSRAPGYDAALAERVWPFYARVFELLDRWLGALVAAAPPETIVALVSDHGHAGVRRWVYVNRILEEAGLLAWDAAGRVDLARTAVAAPFSDFQLRVNGTERRGGIVPPEDRAAVLRRATAALLAARDPENGAAVVRLVARPEEVPAYGIAGPLAGDLLFDLAPGYYLRTGRSGVAVTPSDRADGGGEHGFWPERREMQAIFYAAGPGIAAGARPGEIRAIDIAPTLAHLLGLPAPAQATGRVLGEAVAR